MIWKIVRFIDDRIHLQQAAGTTKVGYNSFYDHKLAQINGLHNYSGTRADREYWSHNMMDAEKEILRIKAHEKQISSVTHSRGPLCNANSSVDRDGNPTELSAKPSTTDASVSFITSVGRLRRHNRRHKSTISKMLMLVRLLPW